MAYIKFSLATSLAISAVASASRSGSHHFASSARGGRQVGVSVDDDVVDPTLCGDGTATSRAGYFDLAGSTDNDGSKNYYFWMYESKNNVATDPVVLWLTGGPGCSSVLALLSENGPCTVNPDGATTTNNPYSWNQNATVIWLDQPAGVGFSYGEENDENVDMVGEDAFFFLQSFMTAHPEYATQPFFVFGESFGGHYAPAVAHSIMTKNQEGGYPVAINLHGLALGNGLTDPVTQYQYYPEMAMNNTYDIKTVSESTYASMVEHVPECVQVAEACQTDPSKCQLAKTLCSAWEMTPYYNTGLNPYDIRIPCEIPGLCYNFSMVDTWLTTPSVLEALHVRTNESAPWESCNYDVNADFSSDWMVGYQGYVADLLQGGIRTLVYAGDVDFVCNWIGNKAWAVALPWSGGDNFANAVDANWTYAGDASPAGLARTSPSDGIFTFLQVYAAGHLVPMDQPAAALNMLNTFIFKETF